MYPDSPVCLVNVFTVNPIGAGRVNPSIFWLPPGERGGRAARAQMGKRGAQMHSFTLNYTFILLTYYFKSYHCYVYLCF